MVRSEEEHRKYLTERLAQLEKLRDYQRKNANQVPKIELESTVKAIDILHQLLGDGQVSNEHEPAHTEKLQSRPVWNQQVKEDLERQFREADALVSKPHSKSRTSLLKRIFGRSSRDTDP
jgi:hypothetical protein